MKPEVELKRQLQVSGNVLRRLEGRLLSLRILPFVLLMLALLLGLDLAFHFSPEIRLVGALFAVGLSVGAFLWVMWFGFVRRQQLRRIARHLESRDVELGSSLINFLDLQDLIADPATPEQTRMFARHAVDNHAQLALKRHLPRLPALPRLRQASRFCVVAVLISLLVGGLGWPIVKMHVPRFLDPYGDHPPFSLTTLSFEEPMAEGAPVVYGQPLRVRVAARGHNPRQVELVYWPTERPAEVYRLPMISRGEAVFAQQISELREPITIMAETSDGRSRTPRTLVDVHLIPQLEDVIVEITPPAYTQLPATTRPYSFNELRVLAGSKIELTAGSNRPLSHGVLRLERPLESDASESVELLPFADSKVRGAFVAERSSGFRLRVMDADGLSSEPSPSGAVHVVSDRAPGVTVTRPGPASLLALDASLEVHIEAHDDYGLAELRVHRAVNGVFSPPLIVRPNASERRMQHRWTVDFSTLGVQSGDVVTLFAEAVDNAPDPQMGRSEMIRIAAVSVDDYNRMLRQEVDMSRIARKYEELKGGFAQIMEEQAAIEAEMEALRKAFSDAADDAERAEIMERFDALREQQAQLNHNLEAVAQKLERIVRDSPLYDVESAVGERFQQEAAALREAAASNQATNQAMDAMRARPDLTPEQQAELMQLFAEAAQAQREQLVGTAGEVEAAHEAMQDMAGFHEMVKNFNRFTELAGQQRVLAEQSAAFDRNGRLSREDQLALRDLAARQKAIADEVHLLGEKLRKDAGEYAETFPEAAASSHEFAEAIEQARVPVLCRRSVDAMLGGSGRDSASLAAAASAAMESLIGQCNGGLGEMRNELDRSLSATRPGGAGSTFEQMLENLQMRYSATGMMDGIGNSGRGQAGMSGGFSVRTGDAPSLVGNESLAAEGDAATQQAGAGAGEGEGASDGRPGASGDATPGALKGLQEEQRRSGSIRAESLFIEHDTIVDAYFKKITQPPAPVQP